jgi:hypothetical protein
MGLSARQQRILKHMESALRARDPRLTSLFGTFTRLTAHEPMPPWEAITARVVRLARPVVLVPVTLAVLTAVITLGVLLPPPPCGAATRTVAVSAAHMLVCPSGVAGTGAQISTGHPGARR